MAWAHERLAWRRVKGGSVYQRVHTSAVRRTNRLIYRQRGVVVMFWIAIAATAAIAQESGGSTTETVATLRNRDLNGVAAVNEQTVTRHSPTNDGDELVIETYFPSIEGGRLALSRRVRRTTKATSNGTQIIEDTEERNLVAPTEPLRLVRRSVTAVHPSGGGSYETDRQVFELDVNGLFVPVLTQTEHASRK
jgi:hypothetical protein